MEEVQGTLRELLTASNFNNGDLTNVQLRYIFSCHDVGVWCTCVRVILGECDPKIVANEVGVLLTASLNTVNEADEEDVAKILGSALDQLPRSNFVALGEFCALLRDTAAVQQQQLACLVGPMLIAPRQGYVTPAVTSAAAAVMDYLIEEAEAVFGRPSCFNRKDAMGVRKPIAVRRPMANSNAGASPRVGGGGGGSDLGIGPPPGLGNSQERSTQDSAQARDMKRMDQLRAFFQFRANDRVKDMSECVTLLFQNHDFEDIAHGVFDRYNMLPPGWQMDLVACREAGSTKLDWFKESQVGMQHTKNAKGRPISFVPVDRGTAKPAADKLSKIDLVVNEIIDTEETYRDNLEELYQSFIVPVREIAAGKKGPEAAEELGLMSQDVEKIFGWRISEITKISATLQKKLEVVSLVRSPPKSPLGRQGFVAQAFIEIASDLHVYAPYVSAHNTSLQTLEKALAKINAANQKKGGIGAALLRGGREKEVISFVKLWEVVSQASNRLKGQTIQSLLILPIQRVPRYKLLLDELIKGTPKDHESYKLLLEAKELVGQAAIQINEALRQHEKLGKFFGKDEMLSPSMSENAKGGGKIKQGYVDA